ncbi:flippase, partial [Lactococcus lactis]|nr:flippase [Lactococcus lactis]
LIITGTSLIGNLSLWPYLRKEIFAPKWKTLALGHHLKPTLLLFLPQIAIQIYTIANKTMIGIFDGKTASGFFSQSDSLIKVTLSIVTSLGVVMLPHV